MNRCPRCGYTPPATDRSAEILALLEGGAAAGQERYLYRTDVPNRWCVTHLRLNGRAPFTDADVLPLVRRGVLATVYPGTEAEGHSYGLASYYGRPSYIRQMAARVAALDARRRKTA